MVVLDDDDEVEDEDGIDVTRPVRPSGASRPIPSADDRLWRHPSEVAAETRAERQRERRDRRRTGARGWLAATTLTALGVLGGRLVVDGLWASQARTVDDAPSASSAVGADEPRKLTDPAATIEVGTPGGRMLVGATVYRGRFLLTAARAVREAVSISVRGATGGSLDAMIVGFDAHTDLAVLRVDGFAEESPPPGPSRLTVGMRTTVLAGPGARPAEAVVTAIDQRERSADGDPMYGFARIGLPPDRGMTGGAVLDGSRRVVGVLNAMPFDGNRFQPGSSVVLPVAIAGPVADAIIDTGTHGHAWLGLVITDPVAEKTDSQRAGAVVTDVRPGSPAADVGLRAGDLIVTIAGRDTPDVAAVMAALLELAPGDTTTVGAFAEGKVTERRVVLGESEVAG